MKLKIKLDNQFNLKILKNSFEMNKSWNKFYI